MLFDLRHDPEGCRFVDAPVSAMASWVDFDEDSDSAANESNCGFVQFD
jgi:hypothetical protein